ncbi:MAG TPA: type II toxin-antitoxin system HicA family toxin [bacterium]|jgi:hypothetical protein
MPQKDKLLKKLCGNPRDFTWDELESLLRLLGYKKEKPGKTAGSRRRFTHAQYAPIILHQPHPQNSLKKYQVDMVIEALEKENAV